MAFGLRSISHERRDEILSCLGRLRERLRLPILCVTHAIDEVVRLADALACGPAAAICADV